MAYKTIPRLTSLCPREKDKELLSDAELLENTIQDIFAGCLSNHLSNCFQGGANFESNELQGSPFFESFYRIDKITLHLRKSSFVADVGYEEMFRGCSQITVS